LDGVVPLSRSLDTLGALAPDVRTAARALEVMSGLTGLVPERPRPLAELRVAVASGWAEEMEPEVAVAWTLVTADLPRLHLPDRSRMARPALTILLHEAAAFHRHWMETCPDRYSAGVRRRLVAGLDIGGREYVGALLEQSRIRVETEAAMRGWDAVLVPTVRMQPPMVGEPHSPDDLTGLTRPFNTTGQPVVTLPAPVPADAAPVGISVVGHFGDDAAAAEVAMALEAAWLAW
jgi:aspartyl-tRNA(Asn)/glutamyl-tRNA(Gln) amidotransferase subunit A